MRAHRRQINPRCSITNSRYLVWDMLLRVRTKLVVFALVGPELVKMLRYSRIVTYGNNIAVPSMLDLERDSACACRDDGFTVVQCFGDFDFEPFAEGELEDARGVCEERVEH